MFMGSRSLVVALQLQLLRAGILWTEFKLQQVKEK
jgi:hypothetical protein